MKPLSTKRNQSIIFGLILIASVLWLAGCSSGKSGSNKGGAAACTAGTGYSATYNGCYPYAGCEQYPGYVWVQQVNQCVPSSSTGVGGYPYPTGGVYRWVGSLSVSDTGNYQGLLRDVGICDVYMWNGGSYSCNNWPGQAVVIVETTSMTFPAQATVTIQPYYNGYPATLIPFAGYLQPYNANTQLQLQRNGFYKGYNKVFSATINSANLGTAQQPLQQFQVTITYSQYPAITSLGTAYVTYQQPYYGYY